MPLGRAPLLARHGRPRERLLLFGRLAHHPTFAQLHREGKAHLQVMRYMDDITIVTTEELADLVEKTARL
jgi:hypothetical protein